MTKPARRNKGILGRRVFKKALKLFWSLSRLISDFLRLIKFSKNNVIN